MRPGLSVVVREVVLAAVIGVVRETWQNMRVAVSCFARPTAQLQPFSNLRIHPPTPHMPPRSYEATITQLRTDIRITQGDIDSAKRDAQVGRWDRMDLLRYRMSVRGGGGELTAGGGWEHGVQQAALAAALQSHLQAHSSHPAHPHLPVCSAHPSTMGAVAGLEAGLAAGLLGASWRWAQLWMWSS